MGKDKKSFPYLKIFPIILLCFAIVHSIKAKRSFNEVESALFGGKDLRVACYASTGALKKAIKKYCKEKKYTPNDLKLDGEFEYILKRDGYLHHYRYFNGAETTFDDFTLGSDGIVTCRIHGTGRNRVEQKEDKDKKHSALHSAIYCHNNLVIFEEAIRDYCAIYKIHHSNIRFGKNWIGLLTQRKIIEKPPSPDTYYHRWGDYKLLDDGTICCLRHGTAAALHSRGAISSPESLTLFGQKRK